MIRAVVVAALGLVAAGIAAVTFAASTSGDVTGSADSAAPHLRRAYSRAAAAAYGRRVLVLHAVPLAPVEAEILESARAGSGWELHPVAPGGADELAVALAELAVDAAVDWGDDGLLDAGTVGALARAAVAIVVVEDGRKLLAPERAAEVRGLDAEPTVPSLRVRTAEPVLRVDGDEARPGGTRPRLVPARVRDYRDGLWGGSVVVEVAEPATYVFAWPRETARVTVDGAAVEPREPLTAMPFVTLDLEPGDVTVSVEYASTSGSATWAIGGALAIVVGLVTLLLALRPHPDREPDDVDGGEDDAA